MLQHACDPEVAHLDLALAVKEYVLRLQVPVQYLAVVDVLDGQRDLHEPVQDGVLGEALPVRLLLGDHLEHVAAVRLVHHDAQAPLVHERLALGHDLGVPHRLEHMHFIQCLLFLFPIHLTHIDYFHYLQFLVLN